MRISHANMVNLPETIKLDCSSNAGRAKEWLPIPPDYADRSQTRKLIKGTRLCILMHKKDEMN
jgi:hypothetical protein